MRHAGESVLYRFAIMPRLRLILLALLLLSGAAVVCLMDSFGYCEVCGICCKECRVVECRVPFSKKVFWRSFEERGTGASGSHGWRLELGASAVALKTRIHRLRKTFAAFAGEEVR